MFFIAVSIHYSIPAGALIADLHTHAGLLTGVSSILPSFSTGGLGLQKGTLPNQKKI